ncbi:hypothetical protein QQ045_032120 [Rhodiola kirilowii]
MERYFSKRPKVSIGSSSSVVQPQTSNADILTTNVELEANLNDEEVEIIETDIVADPGLCKPIESYESNIRDRIRREYVAKGPCHPKDIIFLERSMEKIIEPLEMLGLKNLSGWSIVSKTMQHFAFERIDIKVLEEYTTNFFITGPACFPAVVDNSLSSFF